MSEPEDQSATLRRWENVLTGIVTLVGLCILFSVVMGLTAVGKGLWALVTTGIYQTESLWQFSGGRGASPLHLLEWDQSVWLILVIPILLMFVLGAINEFDAWLRRTPAERAEVRRKADERAFEARKQERAAKEAEKAAKARRKQERASRKPMSGWRRLWIVVSIVLGFPSYLLVADSNSSAFVTLQTTPAMATLTGQEWIDEGFWSAQPDHQELQSCILSTTRVTPGYSAGQYYVSCDRLPVRVFFDSILWAFLPALLLAVIGLTTRWVYRGFKGSGALKSD